MIQNLIFRILFFFFLNIISVSGIQLFCILPHVSVEIIRVFLFFWFSSRKPQSQQKLAKTITHSFAKKNSFSESQLTWHWKLHAVVTQPKVFLTLQIFKSTFFLVSEKNTCTASFLDAQDLHSWRTLKTNLCIFFYISVRKVLFLRHSKTLSGLERQNDFLKRACCLSLVKCFTVSYFNWNFRKLNHF